MEAGLSHCTQRVGCVFWLSHGFDLCRKISKDSNKQTPVIITTGFYKGEHYKTEAIDTFGAAAFFEKPYKNEDLMTTIHELLGNGTAEGVKEIKKSVQEKKAPAIDIEESVKAMERSIKEQTEALEEQGKNAADPVSMQEKSGVNTQVDEMLQDALSDFGLNIENKPEEKKVEKKVEKKPKPEPKQETKKEEVKEEEPSVVPPETADSEKPVEIKEELEVEQQEEGKRTTFSEGHTEHIINIEAAACVIDEDDANEHQHAYHLRNNQIFKSRSQCSLICGEKYQTARSDHHQLEENEQVKQIPGKNDAGECHDGDEKDCHCTPAKLHQTALHEDGR